MAPLPDEIKKQDIIDELTWDDRINANEVLVEVHDGNVTLKGKVPNFSSKVAATRDAYRIAGVKNVKNEIDVEFPATVTYPNDDEITANIHNMLLWNSDISSAGIIVETNNGIVTLTGTVPTYWEKYLAEDIANSTNGVLGVINSLDVVLEKSATDIDIETDIRNAYRRSVLIDEKKINVNAKNGVVTLSGSVITYPVKREALDIAYYTTGVIDVIDDLRIEF
ncbi:MAG: BON domain-containing protein [Bacteroidota bacterium]